jgi:hypothetical protein
MWACYVQSDSGAILQHFTYWMLTTKFLSTPSDPISDPNFFLFPKSVYVHWVCVNSFGSEVVRFLNEEARWFTIRCASCRSDVITYAHFFFWCFLEVTFGRLNVSRQGQMSSLLLKSRVMQSSWKQNTYEKSALPLIWIVLNPSILVCRKSL